MPQAVSSLILTAESRIPSSRIPLSFVVDKVVLGQVLLSALQLPLTNLSNCAYHQVMSNWSNRLQQ